MYRLRPFPFYSKAGKYVGSCSANQTPKFLLARCFCLGVSLAYCQCPSNCGFYYKSCYRPTSSIKIGSDSRNPSSRVPPTGV